MPTINDLARRVLPARVWNTVKSAAGYRVFYDQVAELRSGVRLRVKDHPDWAVFAEVFVDGGYDRAILDTVRDAAAREGGAQTAGTQTAGVGRPVVVLDLGANAGFFTLRVVDLLRREAPGAEARVLAVEAGDRPARKFRDRVFGDNRLGREVTLVHGLVGRRTGSAPFVEYPATTTNNVFDEVIGGATLDYVDLEAHVGPGPVDLVKCDIEGSEQAFLESYGPLLARTRRVVVELHEAFVDYDACRDLLRGAGFRLVETEVAGPCETDYWTRDDAPSPPRP